MSVIEKGTRCSSTQTDGFENKIKNICKNDLERIFKKLEPNAYTYDKNQRDLLLQNLNKGNSLSTKDYKYISQTYSSHINELLPEDENQDNTGILSLALVFLLLSIALRLLLKPYQQPVVLVMAAYGIIAVAFTLFFLGASINKRIDNWISRSALLDDDKNMLKSKYRKTKWTLWLVAWLLALIVIIVQAHLYFNGELQIGNDVMSIIAFGIALISDNVETFFVQRIETKLRKVEL